MKSSHECQEAHALPLKGDAMTAKDRRKARRAAKPLVPFLKPVLAVPRPQPDPRRKPKHETQ